MPTSTRQVFGPPLSELDHDLLELVCRLRVVTQTQLERLHPDVPGRTIRYRTQRLYRNGLLGRSRPYRDRGSAPHPLWPTNRADALVRGKRPPRRGERREPNPLFVAHGAASPAAATTKLTLGFRRTDQPEFELFEGPACRALVVQR